MSNEIFPLPNKDILNSLNFALLFVCLLYIVMFILILIKHFSNNMSDKNLLLLVLV